MNVDIYKNAVNASSLSDEAKERALTYLETYDKKYIEEVTKPYVFAFSPYGSMFMRNAETYRNDPYKAKSFTRDNGTGYVYLIFDGEALTEAVEADVNAFLHEKSKAAGFPDIPYVNNVSGYLVSFDELRGSVPEFMRAAFEEKVFDEGTGMWKQPHVEKLRWYHENEVNTILGYLRHDMKRVKLSDKDNAGHEEWVDARITKLSFGFNRFDSCNMAAKPARAQVTAFFSVSDQSPDFNPDVKFNWHCQDTSRWLYAGAISMDYTCDKETGKETIRIGSHH